MLHFFHLGSSWRLEGLYHLQDAENTRHFVSVIFVVVGGGGVVQSHSTVDYIKIFSVAQKMI